jgi:F420-dependent oxidoreductase-like protein
MQPTGIGWEGSIPGGPSDAPPPTLRFSAMSIAIGLQVWASSVSWPDLMAAGRAIDAMPFETLWSNDHFVPALGQESVVGQVDGPIFEGWSVLSGWAAATDRIRLGCLVSSVSYRNPALLVRMATAVDHASNGRALLGIGAGWHEREHRMYGFPYPTVGERLDRLEEAAAICRGMLDGGPVTLRGRWFQTEAVLNDPPPLQVRMPIVIGGSGERRTLRIVARYADWWNADGNDPAEFARLSSVLDDHCAAVGRDPAEIRRTVSQPPPLIRPTRDAARRDLAEILHRHGLAADIARDVAAASPYAGPRGAAEDRLAELAEAGASLAVFDWMAPFDQATLEALAELARGPAPDS